MLGKKIMTHNYNSAINFRNLWVIGLYVKKHTHKPAEKEALNHVR